MRGRATKCAWLTAVFRREVSFIVLKLINICCFGRAKRGRFSLLAGSLTFFSLARKTHSASRYRRLGFRRPVVCTRENKAARIYT